MGDPNTIHDDTWRTRAELWLRGALIAFAACLPVTVALAQVFGFGSLLLWVILRFRFRPTSEEPNPLALPILLFIAWALVASAIGVRPSASFGRAHRLFIYLLPLAIPSAARRAPGGPPAFAAALVRAFLFGAFLIGLYDAVRIPWQAARGAWLFGLGNMRDPQFHMTALLLLTAVGWPPPKPAGRRRVFLLRTAAAGAGLLLHFKRGVWFSFLLALSIPVTAFRRWRVAGTVLLAVAVLLCAPPVRHRLADIEREWSRQRGGRRDLWTRTAPEMIRARPLGFGPRAVRHEDLRAFSPRKRRPQRSISHLHNNLLHITVEFGWPGVAGWLAWMGSATALMLRARRRTKPGSPERRIAVGVLGAFAALHINGIVEYNFGDSEILMLFMLLMGISACMVTNRALKPGSCGKESTATNGEETE